MDIQIVFLDRHACGSVACEVETSLTPYLGMWADFSVGKPLFPSVGGHFYLWQ